MTDEVQGLISAAVRVVRTSMKGVPIDSPMARALFGLAIELQAAGILQGDETKAASDRLSLDAINQETGAPCPTE